MNSCTLLPSVLHSFLICPTFRLYLITYLLVEGTWPRLLPLRELYTAFCSKGLEKSLASHVQKQMWEGASGVENCCWKRMQDVSGACRERRQKTVENLRWQQHQQLSTTPIMCS